MNRALVSASVLLPLLLSACAMGPRLLDERSAEPFRSLLVEAEGYTHTHEHVPAGPDATGGLQMHVTHVASNAPEGRLVVCVHGLIAASHSWRFVEGPLAARNDVLLVDLPGCGQSDKPEPTHSTAEVYSPAWLAVHLLRAVDRFTKARGSSQPIVLVGHSLGAATVLRAATDPLVQAAAPDVAQRIERLVLISPPDVVVEDASEGLRLFTTLDQTRIDFARSIGIYDLIVDEGVRRAVVAPEKSALCQESRHIGGAIAGCGTRRAAHAMLRRYNPTHRDGSIDHDEVSRLHGLQQQFALPVLVIVGKSDEVVSPANGKRIVERLRDAMLVELPTRHSPNVEQAADTARRIQVFIDRGEATVVAGAPR